MTKIEDRRRIEWKKDARRVIRLRDSGVTDWKGLGLSKVLGDAMEALIVAIFVDSGFDLETVQEVLSLILYQFVDRSNLDSPASKNRKFVKNDNEEITRDKRKKTSDLVRRKIKCM